MKAQTLLIILLALFAGQISAQSPTGDLYVFGQNELQYVSFPAGTTNTLDSLGATNATNSSTRLYTSFSYELTNPRSISYGIASYDLATHQRIDTSTQHPAVDVDVWDNMLVVTTNQAPFLRVVDPAMQYQSRFEVLDSSFTTSPLETLVLDDRAYVLFADKVAVVDLDLEDTLAVIRTDTIPRFWTTAYNWSLEAANGQVLIYAEYATGAIRTTLMKIDPATLTASQVAHMEFQMSWHPVAAGDEVFAYRYPSFYDTNTDSLYIDSTSYVPGTTSFTPLAFDAQSQAIFALGIVEVNGRMPLMVFPKGQLPPNPSSRANIASNSRTYRGYWVPLSVINGLDQTTSFQFSVHPNPTPDMLEVNFPAPTEVYRYRMLDASGRTLLAGIPQGNRGFRIDLRDLPRGGYFLEIQSEEGTVSEQVVKW